MTPKVMLIYPPTLRCLREDRCQIPARNILMSPSFPPTDLLYLAATAERAGARCMIVDYTAEGRGPDGFIRDLASFSPDYLVIAATTPTLRADLSYCRTAKNELPFLTIIAKGAHFLAHDREALMEFPFLDMVIRGEPEITLEEIVRGTAPDEIAGITRRGRGGICRNPDRAFVEGLDDLPFPARHLIDNRRFVRPDTGRPQAVVKVSRGCPYHCFYCLATPVSGEKVRRRSTDNIMAEIQECYEKYGIRDFLFWSDVFNTDREWVLSLCSTIQESGLSIRWAANSRAEFLDGEVAEAMRRSGCTLVSIGVESGSQEMLDKMQKNLDLEQVRRAFSILKRCRIPSIAYYQIGLPWETRQTAEETIRFSLDLDSDYASFFVSVPFPGTRFHDYAVENGLFENGDSELSAQFGDAYYRPVVRGHFLAKTDIEKLRNTAIRKYLCRPGYIVRNLRRIRSWKELARYAAAATSFI